MTCLRWPSAEGRARAFCRSMVAGSAGEEVPDWQVNLLQRGGGGGGRW